VIELDDADVTATTDLVVTFTDRVEHWGPGPLELAQLTATRLAANPPAGFVSAHVEQLPEDRDDELDGEDRGVAQDYIKAEHGYFAGARPKRLVNPIVVRDWHDTYGEAIASAAKAHGMTTKAYTDAANANIQRVFDEAHVQVNVPTEYMDEILADGRLKSQFESSTSQGALNPPLRAAQEEALFALPSDTPPAQRPIYGYLQTAPASESIWGSTDRYGDVVLTLNDSVRARTTATWDDSFPAPAATPIKGATIAGYTEMGAAGSVPQVLKGQFSKVDPLTLPSVDAFRGHAPYVEAQVHGGVSVKDIAKVTFVPRPDPVMGEVDWDHTAIKAQLDKLGIPWEDAQ
jgi:hypothetical protein